MFYGHMTLQKHTDWLLVYDVLFAYADRMNNNEKFYF